MRSLWLLPFPTLPPRGLVLPASRRGAALLTPSLKKEGDYRGYVKKATDDVAALAQGTAHCSGGGQALYRP